MSSLFERFSSKENLKKAYLYVQDELAHSALSVNPITYASTTAINDLGDRFFKALEQHIRNGNYKPEKGFFIYMPKDNLGLRPVCVFSMVDRIIYQAIFNQDILGDKIDGQLLDSVCFANRVNEDANSDHFLSSYLEGWNLFCKEQGNAFEKGFCWKIEFDVQQYYEHIPIDRLIDKLREDFEVKDEKILQILKDQLHTWVEYSDLPKGIPQGPDASAIISNVYLSSLDNFAKKEVVSKNIKYFRYADDITLMGKTKEEVLRATEKIVRFLRDENLNLNEKTKIGKISDGKKIERMRFFSEYEEDEEDEELEIPEDELTRVQNIAPSIVTAIKLGANVDKQQIKELKYFLRGDTNYSLKFIFELIEIIPIRPSLTVPIIQYVAESRSFFSDFGDELDVSLIDYSLLGAYGKADMPEWSRFWILKLLVSNKNISIQDMTEEVQEILSLKENSIFKIVCFYYQVIQEKELNVEQVRQAINNSITSIEKSLYSFFLLNTPQKTKASLVKNQIEGLLNSSSQELNLIGSYLFKNKPKIEINDVESPFSCLILRKKNKAKTRPRKNATESKKDENDFYMVRKESLIPIGSPSLVLGVSRPRKKKLLTELIFPEMVVWEKVKLKLKEGLQTIEIWYDDKHIKTVNYVELGFSATQKEHRPDKKWNFLCILSVLQNEDIRQATPDNLMPMLAKHSGHAIGKSNVHQTKRQLSTSLRALFKTGDDPFSKNRKYYEPRFKILPESMMRQRDLWKQGGKLNENIDYEEENNLEE